MSPLVAAITSEEPLTPFSYLAAQPSTPAPGYEDVWLADELLQPNELEAVRAAARQRGRRVGRGTLFLTSAVAARAGLTQAADPEAQFRIARAVAESKWIKERVPVVMALAQKIPPNPVVPEVQPFAQLGLWNPEVADSSLLARVLAVLQVDVDSDRPNEKGSQEGLAVPPSPTLPPGVGDVWVKLIATVAPETGVGGMVVLEMTLPELPPYQVTELSGPDYSEANTRPVKDLLELLVVATRPLLACVGMGQHLYEPDSILEPLEGFSFETFWLRWDWLTGDEAEAVRAATAAAAVADVGQGTLIDFARDLVSDGRALEPEALFDTSLSIARVLAAAARRARDAVQARQ